MAIIGARPVSSPWFIPGRGRPRPRIRPRPRAARRGTGSRVLRRVESRLDVRPLLVVIVVAAALALFYLSQSAHVAATGYEIDSLQNRLAEARARQQQIVSAIGEARSPSSITRRAREELHLVPLDQGAVTYATDGSEPAD